MPVARNVKRSLNYAVKAKAKSLLVYAGIVRKKAQFEERRKHSKNKNVSKREVNNYMKKQNKEDDFANSALAEQLAKLGLNKKD